MTKEQLGEAIVTSRILDKLVFYLLKNFHKLGQREAEDVAHIALIRAARKPEAFPAASQLESYLYETTKFAAMQYIKRERARRELRRLIPYSRLTHRDPTLGIDYRIDLERSIRQGARANSLRQALWMHIIEGWDFDELTPRLPTERAKRTWYNHLREGMSNVRQEMRRKGYYRFGRR